MIDSCVNFEHIQHVTLVFLLLTLNMLGKFKAAILTNSAKSYSKILDNSCLENDNNEKDNPNETSQSQALYKKAILLISENS